MRWLMWFFMPGSLVLLIWGIWGGRWAEQFTFEGSVIWLENTGSWAWLAGALLLSGDLIFPVPGTIVISALGFIYGALLGGLIATVSMVIAGFLGYGIGRLCSERFACRLLGEKDFHAGRQLFIRRGGWVVALSRALPILPEVISCTAGLVRMPVGRFALALICGSLPTGFLFAAIGNTGKETPSWAFAISLLVPGALWWIANRIKR